MLDGLSGSKLLHHVRSMSTVVGPRPAGTRAEMLSRQYVRYVLRDLGFTDKITESSFKTPKSTGYVLAVPLVITLLSNIIARKSRWIAAVLTLLAAYNVFQFAGGRRQPLAGMLPSTESANLVVKLSPTSIPKKRVVLIAHMDTNKNRLTFKPMVKSYLPLLFTSGIAMALLNAAAHIFSWHRVRNFTLLKLVSALLILGLDELDEYVDGANGNASGAACLLGIASMLKEHPLENTEVWLAFTGAAQTGNFGIQHLIDTNREALANAWFINLEMVGAGDIAYLTRYSGLSALNRGFPDDESLALAVETARENPQLSVRGVPMMIVDEARAVRNRGFRGLSVVGVGHDGWPVNWNQSSDTIRNINPQSLERAARFVWAMIHNLDSK